MKRTFLLLTALALATSGCGRFGSEKSTATTLLGEGKGVGAGLTTPSTAVPPTTATTGRPATATTVAAAARCPYTDSTSEIDYAGRLRLTLTVTPLCPKKADDIGFTLKVTNISSAVVHYDRNQIHFFSLLAYPRGEGRLRWEDTHCNRPSGGGSQTAGNLAPGASVSFTTLYPAPKQVADREKCRRLETGGYEGRGVFLVCDGAAYTDGYCDTSKTTQFEAHPVLINVG